MLTIYDIMKDINNQPEPTRLEYANQNYSQYFNKDIVEYLLVRHCNQYCYFEEFNNLDCENCTIRSIRISSDEIFSKLDYAKFCEYKDETQETYELLQATDYNYWPLGTWTAPIIVTSVNDKYIAIDGNNRLRMLRAFLKYSNHNKSNYHNLYLINNI